MVDAKDKLTRQQIREGLLRELTSLLGHYIHDKERPKSTLTHVKKGIEIVPKTRVLVLNLKPERYVCYMVSNFTTGSNSKVLTMFLF